MTGRTEKKNTLAANTISRFFDIAFQPPVAYPSRGYAQQIRHHLRTAIKGRRVAVSLLHAVRLISLLSASIITTPISAALRCLGIRFISVDMTQIGSTLYLDQIIRDNFLQGRTQRWKLLVARCLPTEANTAAYDLYCEYVTYITHPLAKLVLGPFFVHPWFQENSMKFDSSQTFITTDIKRMTVAYKVWNQYESQFGGPLVKLDEAARARCRQDLAEFIPPERRFVVVHVRDSGFYGDYTRTTRNGDIKTYESAFRYLISQGYMVVRIGDPNMVHIDDMISRCGPELFDYAHSSVRSELRDCYLVDSCEFYIGNGSGPWSLAAIMHKPGCLVNYYSAATSLGFNEHDISTFKKFFRSDGTLIPFEEILKPPFSLNSQRDILAQHGAYLEDNTEEEILETVKEFLTRGTDYPTERQKRAKTLMHPLNHAYGGAGHFADAILKVYGM